MTLCAMQYFMGRTITYTPASAKAVLRALKTPMSRAWDARNISSPLNRQLKCVMNTLLYELTRRVFEDLEKELKTKNMTTVWGTTFCTVCLLCFYMEEVQIATNGFIMHKRQHDPDGDPPSPEKAIEICRKLDDGPYTYLIELFHGTFKSQKKPMSYRAYQIFNPIRDGADMDIDENVDRQTLDLADEVRQVIKECSESLSGSENTNSTDKTQGRI
jgi:hypothetical protein